MVYSMVIAKGETAVLSTLMFIVWVVMGALIYATYGYRKNREAENLVEEVIEKETVDTSENILAEMSFSDVTVETDNLTDELRDNVIFGIISSEDACACYELASRYLGSIDNMEISEWLTSVMYDDAYTKIFIINDIHYKFIIKYDKSMIYMTDNI